MNKQEARKYIRHLKAELDIGTIKEKSRLIMEKIKGLEQFKNAPYIMTYVNYNQEVETIPLIEDCLKMNRKILVPKVYGKEMLFHLIRSMSELRPGAYGILEPVSTETVTPDKAFMLMPGLAFDRDRHRAGYGGGYYDRYLADKPGIYRAAVAFDFQLVEQLQVDCFDLCPDIIVTDKEIIGGGN
jgi:5-formyltetrahydrofolate cyclo-ligase